MAIVHKCYFLILLAAIINLKNNSFLKMQWKFNVDKFILCGSLIDNVNKVTFI